VVEHAHEDPTLPARPPEGPPREVARSPRSPGGVEWEEYARRLHALAHTEAARAMVEAAVSRMRADPASAEDEYRRTLARL
jgi:hypothetical protein